MSNVILKLKYILRDIKGHVMMIDNNLYHINSLFKKFNIERFDENTSDLMKVFVGKKEFKEKEFKSCLEDLKDE